MQRRPRISTSDGGGRGSRRAAAVAAEEDEQTPLVPLVEQFGEAEGVALSASYGSIYAQIQRMPPGLRYDRWLELQSQIEEARKDAVNFMTLANTTVDYSTRWRQWILDEWRLVAIATADLPDNDSRLKDLRRQLRGTKWATDVRIRFQDGSVNWERIIGTALPPASAASRRK